MLTYKDIKIEAKKRYPDNKDIWNRVAFINGAMFYMRNVCPENEADMDVPYVTLD